MGTISDYSDRSDAKNLSDYGTLYWQSWPNIVYMMYSTSCFPVGAFETLIRGAIDVANRACDASPYVGA